MGKCMFRVGLIHCTHCGEKEKTSRQFPYCSLCKVSAFCNDTCLQKGIDAHLHTCTYIINKIKNRNLDSSYTPSETTITKSRTPRRCRKRVIDDDTSDESDVETNPTKKLQTSTPTKKEYTLHKVSDIEASSIAEEVSTSEEDLDCNEVYKTAKEKFCKDNTLMVNDFDAKKRKEVADNSEDFSFDLSADDDALSKSESESESDEKNSKDYKKSEESGETSSEDVPASSTMDDCQGIKANDDEAPCCNELLESQNELMLETNNNDAVPNTSNQVQLTKTGEEKVPKKKLPTIRFTIILRDKDEQDKEIILKVTSRMTLTKIAKKCPTSMRDFFISKRLPDCKETTVIDTDDFDKSLDNLGIISGTTLFIDLMPSG